MPPLLEVKGLHTEFRTGAGLVRAVDGISYTVDHGETVAIVGESGSGKSVGALSILRLIPDPPGRITAGEILFDGRDLRTLSEAEMREVRGARHRHGVPGADDLAQSGADHRPADHRDAGTASAAPIARRREQRALELLDMVGIADAAAPAAGNTRISSPAACASG